MIVNPQFFNYRLTIGVLVVAISVLAVLSYSGLNDLKSENEFLSNEKKIIRNEISKVILSNNKLEEENKSLNQELENYKTTIVDATDSITILKSDRKRFAHKYERLLSDVKSQNNSTKYNSVSLDSEINNIEEPNVSQLDKRIIQKNQYGTIKSEINEFHEISESSPVIIKESIKAKAYRIKNNDSKVKTEKANKTNAIEVCFALSNNVNFEKLKNEFYIQIISPNNNVVSDKGVKKFNKNSLIYSLKTKLLSSSENVNICEYVYSEEKLTKGTYFINVFDENTQLVSTKLELY